MAVLVLLAVGFFGVLPRIVDGRLNRVLPRSYVEPGPDLRAFHQSLFIVDLHADSLGWKRNLLVQNSRGHVDLPRLLAGNVGLQFFTVFTKVPRGAKLRQNRGDTDSITLLTIANGRPLRTWNSRLERALDQAGRLRQLAADSGGRLTLIRSADDLNGYLARRTTETGLSAGLLGLEGAHALEGDVANLGRLHAAGFRMIGLAHFFDNSFAGSAHGLRRHGLTDKGRQLLAEMRSRRMLLDLAHSSEATFAEAARLWRGPLVVSHTGVRGSCDNARNLTDAQLRLVARSGGIVGIGFWRTAVCGADVASIVRAIRYAVRVIGARHVGLGSDFDGAVTTPLDAAGLIHVTNGLLRTGVSRDDVRAIMGGNMQRLLLREL